MGIILLQYFLLGIVIAIIHWFCICETHIKDKVNICIGLLLSFLFWSIIIIGWLYRIIEYSIKNINVL